jgi:protein tyrosine phosphatase
MVRLGNDNSDPVNYINANYITTVVKDYNFIATQGPLTSTITNFWKMVEQNDV